MNLSDLEAKQAAINDLCEQYEVRFMGVFGSVARNQATAESDVDVLVRFVNRKNLFDVIRLERQLAQTFGRPVDLVTEPALSPYLRSQILAETIPLYEKA